MIRSAPDADKLAKFDKNSFSKQELLSNAVMFAVNLCPDIHNIKKTLGGRIKSNRSFLQTHAKKDHWYIKQEAQ